jgi:hypothetical protein
MNISRLSLSKKIGINTGKKTLHLILILINLIIVNENLGAKNAF